MLSTVPPRVRSVLWKGVLSGARCRWTTSSCPRSARSACYDERGIGRGGVVLVFLLEHLFQLGTIGSFDKIYYLLLWPAVGSKR
jgi:hypothetical protein